MKSLTGGQVIINDDAVESADILEKIIMEIVLMPLEEQP